MNNKTKRLIYHLFIPNNTKWQDLNVLKIHFECLKEYSSIFTEALFVISLNDINDVKTIEEVEHKIISIGYHNVEFKIVKNDNLLCESETLYNEIINKMNTLDGLTFFAHSKGVGNEIFDNCDINNLYNWIIGLYYFSLSDAWEVECKLYGVWGTTYGAFKTKGEYDNKYNWIYSGTFYWINCQRLADKIKRENLEVRQLSNRFCSETFLGDIINMELKTSPQEAESYCGSYLINATDYYNNISYYISLITNDNTLNNYNNFKNKILNICKI